MIIFYNKDQLHDYTFYRHSTNVINYKNRIGMEIDKAKKIFYTFETPRKSIECQ